MVVDTVLIIAASAEGNIEYPYLDMVNEEAKKIEKYLEKFVEVEVLLDEDAVRPKVMSAIRSGKFQALHFTGHSEFDANNPEYSALVLNNDQKITLKDISRLTMDKTFELVFLNSCESGATDIDNKLFKTHGLADSFLNLGVRYVIAHQWHVRDESSPEFARAFYESLSEGSMPEDAMRLARNKVYVKFNEGEDPIWASPILFKG
jgi:CHAT domain-containing protein